MSFKTEIEITGYDQEYCGECELVDRDFHNYCTAPFDFKHESNCLEYDEEQGDLLRCNECIAREINYKNMMFQRGDVH